MSLAYFQGKIQPIHKVKISPYDLGFLRGYAVFDIMKVVNQKPFLIREHWRRLKYSAQQINLKVPLNCQEYKKIIIKLLQQNKLKQTIIRTILTGGVSDDGFTYQGKSNFLIFLEDARRLLPPSDVYQKGAKVITLEYKRELPTAKVTNYLEALSYQKEKRKQKALEIIYFWGKNILEATTSNIFIVNQAQKIITPQENVLMGITRNLVIRLAQKNGYQVEERAVSFSELKKAKEVFLTASNKNIVPVTEIDRQKVFQGKVGEITQDLMNILNNYLEKY